jgi:small basic protein (TIGR04137 family)
LRRIQRGLPKAFEQLPDEASPVLRTTKLVLFCSPRDRPQFQHCGTKCFCYSNRSFLTEIQLKKIMSLHPSLRAASTLGGKRNVLKRFERTELLKKRGQWKPGDRITGLRKTKPAV